MPGPTKPPTSDPVAKATADLLDDQAAKVTSRGKDKGPGGRRPADHKRPQPARVRKAAARHARRAGRQARHPARAARSGTWLGLVIGSVALILLYNALTGADRLAGFFGGVSAALAWLNDPTKPVVRYKGES